MKVDIFAICNKDYIDISKIALCSFYEHYDYPITLFLTDDSSELFKKIFKDYKNVTFKDFGKNTKTFKFIKENFEKFDNDFSFCFDKEKMINVFIANEITDYISNTTDADIIQRLDLDVLFFKGELEKSWENFYNSGKTLGGSQEDYNYFKLSRRRLYGKNYIDCEIYLNAGNFMYRVDKMIKNQYETAINLIKEHGFEKFHFFDQDTVNKMYSDKDKYAVNKDGWLIQPEILSGHYQKIKDRNIINIHYVGSNKPFILPSESYDNRNERSLFYFSFEKYLSYAIKTKCSEGFVNKIKENIKIQSKMNFISFRPIEMKTIIEIGKL